MTEGGFLLLYLTDGVAAPRGWMRLHDGAIVSRGPGAPAAPMAHAADERVILIVPGEDVVIHWIELPTLAPAQAMAAARLMASEVSAAPLDRLHVALGRSGGAARAMALVEPARMAAWLGQAQALGLDPDAVVPEPLLLVPPDAGLVRWERGGIHLVRGENVAFAAEPALAALIDEGAVLDIDDATMEAGIGGAVAAPLVDLRQGAFARRRRWRIDWPLVRRLAVLGALTLLAVLAIQVVLIAKYERAADQAEQAVAGIARTALPRAATVADPAGALSGRLADLRGAGAGFSATASAVFAAVRDTANVELAALSFDQGVMRVTATSANPADIAALSRRIEASGFLVSGGDVRPGGGRQIAEITVRSR